MIQECFGRRHYMAALFSILYMCSYCIRYHIGVIVTAMQQEPNQTNDTDHYLVRQPFSYKNYYVVGALQVRSRWRQNNDSIFCGGHGLTGVRESGRRGK